MQTPSLFLCNELGPFQAILGNVLGPFQAISGTSRQFRVISGDLGGPKPKKKKDQFQPAKSKRGREEGDGTENVKT